MKIAIRAVLGLALVAAVGLVGASFSQGWLDGGGAVATVNGKMIPRLELDKLVEAEKRQVASQFNIDFNTGQGKELLTTIQRNAVQRLVERELMMQQAAHLGIEATVAEAEVKLGEVRRRFPDQAKFEAALKQSGITETELREQIMSGVRIEKLQARAAVAKQPTDAACQAYYAAHPEEFRHPEAVSASHILVKATEGAPDPAADRKRVDARIQEIQAKLKAGKDFAALAREYSDDPGSKEQGGELGFFERGRMVPEFEKAAYALRPGQISAPVRTQFGVHLIRRGETRPASQDSFARALPTLREKLTAAGREEAFKEMVRGLRASASIGIKPEFAMPAKPPASGSAR